MLNCIKLEDFDVNSIFEIVSKDGGDILVKTDKILETEKIVRFTMIEDNELCLFEGFLTRDDNNIFILKGISKIKNIQRREFFRISVSSDCTVQRLNCKMESCLDKGIEKGFLINISAGGVKFATSGKLAVNSVYLITVEELNIDSFAIFILKSHTEQNSKNTFIYSARFLNLENCVRDSIIKSIFATYAKYNKRV